MSENKRYYWLKLKEDFFGDKTIKKLRRIAGGDTYTVIYLKMLLKSLRDNGKLYFEGVESDFASELALDIDEDEENVKITVQFLMSYGLLEKVNEDEFVLAKCIEMTGNESYSAERMRNLRKRQKIASQCDTPVTLSDVDVICCDEEKEIEIDKEKEIEIDKDKEIEKDELDTPYLTCNSKAVTQKQISCTDIVNLYHSICLSYPKIIKLSEARKKAIKARLNQYSLEDFRQVFENAEDSDFLKGNNQRDWSATFDWLISDKNMPKVLEGKYNNNKKKNRGKVNDEQCYTDEQLRIARDLEDFIAKGYTIESLQQELGEEFPKWFLDYYNKQHTADGKKIQM